MRLNRLMKRVQLCLVAGPKLLKRGLQCECNKETHCATSKPAKDVVSFQLPSVRQREQREFTFSPSLKLPGHAVTFKFKLELIVRTASSIPISVSYKNFRQIYFNFDIIFIKE